MHGNWVEDENVLQQIANEFYIALFSNNGNDVQWQQTELSFPKLSEDELQDISCDIVDEEIRRAVFSMSPWKAPGPDGFPAGFYQKSWNIVGKGVCDFVRQVWANPLLLREVNCTDICLIPKVERPEFIHQFRPISLCNTIYKIVSKVLSPQLSLPIKRALFREEVYMKTLLLRKRWHIVCAK
jgi:hypothetical protein